MNKMMKSTLRLISISIFISSGLGFADECSDFTNSHQKLYEQKLNAHAAKAPRLGQNFTKESLASYDALKKAHREEGERLIQEMKITGKKNLEDCHNRRKMGQ